MLLETPIHEPREVLGVHAPERLIAFVSGDGPSDVEILGVEGNEIGLPWASSAWPEAKSFAAGVSGDQTLRVVAHEGVEDAADLKDVGAQGGGGVGAVLFCGMCQEGEEEGEEDVPGAMKPGVPMVLRIWPWSRA